MAGFLTFHGRLVLRRSADAGETWGTPVRFEGGSDYAISGHDSSVDVVWQQDARVFYTRSTDGGLTFGSPIVLSARSRGAELPSVARDADGHVAAVWRDMDPDFGSPWGPVLIRVSTDGGASFGPSRVVDVSEVDHGSVFPGGALLGIGGGTIYVAYGLDNRRTRLRRSDDWGLTWFPRVTISNHALGRPQITADGAQVYVAFTLGRSDELWAFYRRSVDGGARWSTPMTLSHQPGRHPVMSVNAGTVDAAFARVTRRFWVSPLFFRRSADGATWSPNEAVDEDWGTPIAIVRVGSRVLVLYDTWNGGDVGRVSRAYVRVRT